MRGSQSLDFNHIKRTRGRLSAYIMGLVAAFIGMHIAIIEAITVFSGSWFFSYSDYGEKTLIILTVLIILLSALNIAGAFFIRPKRIAGGIIMLAASVPLFTVSVMDPDFMFIMGPTSLTGIAAAILAFVPLSDGYIYNYIENMRYREELKALITPAKNI